MLVYALNLSCEITSGEDLAKSTHRAGRITGSQVHQHTVWGTGEGRGVGGKLGGRPQHEKAGCEGAVLAFHPLVVLFRVFPAARRSLDHWHPGFPSRLAGLCLRGPGQLAIHQARVEGVLCCHLELVLISDSWHFCIWTESKGGFPLRSHPGGVALRCRQISLSKAEAACASRKL